MSLTALNPANDASSGSIRELAIPEPTDRELVERAQKGDAWAEEALFRRHVTKVTQLATRLLGRGAEAEDVVQDAFVIALEQLPKLRDGAAFRPWLLRIVVHQAHRRFRRRRLLRALGISSSDDIDGLARQASPTLEPELRAELTKLDEVLDRLPTRQRLAWVLRHVEGYQLDEVATACECSLATVKRTLARADARIRKHVRVEEQGDEQR